MQSTRSFFAFGSLAAILLFAAYVSVQTVTSAAAQKTNPPAYEWLALCSKCLSPSITSKSGIGTSYAVAQARISRADAEGWCQNWQPGDDLQACVREQLSSEEAKKTYRATADCKQGRITPIDGNTYTLAGIWDNSDIGGGRTKWRDSSGQIVGRDNASGGLGISQQWEVLCPGPPPLKGIRSKAAPSPAKRPLTPPPSARRKPQ